MCAIIKKILTEKVNIIMKKTLTFTLVALCCGVAISLCADDNEIKLPSANLKNDVSLKKALELRKTNRTFSRRALSELDISNLLWAAYGVNRPDGKRTIPAARGINAVEMYVALPEGVYKHNVAENILTKISDTDMRSYSDGRKMGVKAPLVLVMVADRDAFDGNEVYPAFEAGAIMQNIYLYCAAAGFNTVVCGSFDKNVWQKELKLPASKYVILTQVVGCKR